MSDMSPGSPEHHIEGAALGGRSINDPKLPPVRPHVRLYWALYLGCFALYAILITIGVTTWDTVLIDAGLKFNLGFPLFALAVIHFAISLQKVETDEVAGKYVYGLPLFKARRGLNFVPRGLMSLVRYDGDLKEIYLPGKLDQVYWGDEKTSLPPGMVRPIWVPTRPPEDVEKDPLDAQMVVGIVGYAHWRIMDVFAFHAYVTSEDEADSQLRNIWIRVAAQNVVKYTAGLAIVNQAKINDRLDDDLRTHTSDWGITITSAGISKINVSHELGAAMRDRAKVRFEQETQQIAADGKAYEIRALGSAEGDSLRAKEAGPLIGRAEGIGAMARIIQHIPEAGQVLAAETARETMERANVIFAGGAEGSLRDLMAGAAAVKKGMEATGGTNASKDT